MKPPSTGSRLKKPYDRTSLTHGAEREITDIGNQRRPVLQHRAERRHDADETDAAEDDATHRQPPTAGDRDDFDREPERRQRHRRTWPAG